MKDQNNFIVNLSRKVNTLTTDTFSSTIIQSSVPTYLGDYAKFNQYNTGSIGVYIEFINITDSPIEFDDPYFSCWLSFKLKNGGTLAKESTSTAFFAESIDNIIVSESVDDGEIGRFVFKLNNPLYEVPEGAIDDIEYWTLNAGYVIDGGTNRFYQGFLLKSLQFTLYPES